MEYLNHNTKYRLSNEIFTERLKNHLSLQETSELIGIPVKKLQALEANSSTYSDKEYQDVYAKLKEISMADIYRLKERGLSNEYRSR